MNRDSPSTSASKATLRQSSLVPPDYTLIDRRVLLLCLPAILLGVVAAFVAQLLMGLMALITNLAYFGDISLQFRTPTNAVGRLGVWSVLIPVIGAILIGLMARFGSKAIRGHGIPEAMEQVLTNESRIPARMAILKPVSAVLLAIEDGFEKLPVHWMWWPAIGAIAVGVVGFLAPDTLSVGFTISRPFFRIG